MELEGPFDCNRTTLAPPGTNVVIHENPDKRAAWAAHGVDRWYLGRSEEHFRCYQVYINNTHAERNSDIFKIHTHQTKVPSIAANGAATTASQEVVASFAYPKPNIEW